MGGQRPDVRRAMAKTNSLNRSVDHTDGYNFVSIFDPAGVEIAHGLIAVSISIADRLQNIEFATGFPPQYFRFGPVEG
jgi:hypothetical protein